jgi:hypothetical protein
MLPPIVLTELFDLRHQVNDVILQHIADELESFGLSVTNIANLDHAILYSFRGPEKLKGELRVDRITRRFEIIWATSEYWAFPVCGDWTEIRSALAALEKEQPHHV